MLRSLTALLRLSPKSRSQQNRTRRPTLEALEGRVTPAVITVGRTSCKYSPS